MNFQSLACLSLADTERSLGAFVGISETPLILLFVIPCGLWSQLEANLKIEQSLWVHGSAVLMPRDVGV